MSPDDEILERPIHVDRERDQRVRVRVRRKLPGRRLDKYLTGRFPQMSRTTIQRLIRQGDVTVNEQPTKPSYEMCDGDVVELFIPAPEPTEIVPQDIPVDIVYEDEYVIAINKHAGIICHPARGGQSGTLANALAFHAARLSRGTDPFRPGIVHRLDKNTTGIMLIAKTDEAHWRLSLQFERRTIEKTYLAVVEGAFDLDADTIDCPIGVHPVVREKFAVLIRQNKIDVGKPAVTHFEVLERFRGYTLVKLSPKTGRTHQLRVHMSYFKRPIAGDTLYGGKPLSEHELSGAGDEVPFLGHQALHAWRIRFRHPITEKTIELEAPFHEQFKRLMRLLREFRGA